MSVVATTEPRTTRRRTWVAVVVITLIVAVPAFLLNPIIWTPAGPVAPTAAQVPYFLAMDVMQAVFLGLGISFLIFGLPIMRRISPDSKTRAWAMYLCIGWLMVSWWPHIGMHVSNAPDDLQRLLYIDYLFHVPLMITGGVLAYCFISLVRQRRRESIPLA